MVVRTSYYDNYFGDFFDYRVFDSLRDAVSFIENEIKAHHSAKGIVTYYINWRDFETEHEIRYDLTFNGWEKSVEC